MVDLWFLEAGSCTHPERVVIRGGRFASVRFGSTVAVIEHPRAGVVLFDTGYSQRFSDATRRFPEKLYALLTPVTIAPEDTAMHQLRARGVAADDVRTVVLSHFHADHMGGAADFPKARFIYQGTAFEAVRDLGRFGAARAGFLRSLLPTDFEARSRPIAFDELRADVEALPWPGHDLFGDESLVLVDLPGHTRGHSGLFVRAKSGVFLLVADACWLSRAFRERRMPHVATSLIMDSRARYRKTLEQIHDLALRQPELHIVPCHCAEAWTSVPHWSDRPAA